MAGQSLDELLIKIKVDLDAFKKSFADAKKVAQQGIKDIENTLNNSGNFRNAGKNAGNSFVQGFNESLKNLKSNTNSAVNDVNKSLGNIGKNNKDIKLKVNADTSGVTSGVSNAGNMISSGLSGIANYAGLEGVKNSVNSLQPAMKSIFKTDGIREYTKYVSNCIDYIDKLKNKEATAGSFDNTKMIVDNILSNLERIKDGKWFGNNINTSSLDELISQLKEARKEAENIKVNPIDKNRSTMPNAPNKTSKQTSPLSGWNGDVASTQQGQSKSQTSASRMNLNMAGFNRRAQENISIIDRLKAKIKELDIPGLGQQTFGSLKNKIRECIPEADNLKNKLKNSLNSIPGVSSIQKAFSNLNLDNITNKIRELFNQKDRTTGKSIEDIGKKAERSSGKIKGLISKLFGLFGLKYSPIIK